MTIEPGKLLAGIDQPADLKLLPEDKLALLCDELRHFIIDVVSLNPGHLGASLGVVDLPSLCTMFSKRLTTG